MTTHSPESSAFRRLQGFAQKVAAELARSGASHDTYVAQRAHQAVVATPGGIFRRSTTRTLSMPDQHQDLGGWRVFSQAQESETLSDTAGAIRSSRFTHQTLEVWLLRTGQLVAVELLDETVSNNVPNSPANVVPTVLKNRRELDYESARRLDGRSTWRTEQKKMDGMTRFSEWRDYRPPTASTPPCVTLSHCLAELRKRTGRPGTPSQR